MSNDTKASIKSHITNILYFIDLILPPPAKIMFVIWTFGIIVYSMSPEHSSDDWKFYLFGYFLYCGIVDLIFYAKARRRYKYMYKITQKKSNRLKKIMDTHYRPITLLNETKRLAEIANKTTDETEFFTSYDKLIETLRELQKYEGKGLLIGSPSNDLQRIIQSRGEETKKFYMRANIASSESVTFPQYDSMSGLEFERFCADLLEKNGYYNVDVTQGRGDHGIDILAEKDDITYAIQCKCYSSNIGNAAVQQAHTGKSLYHKDIAVVLTNQYFTAQAQEEANALGVKLWDRGKLQDLIEKAQ